MIIKDTKDLLNILTTIKFCDVDEIEKIKAIDLAIEIIKDWSHHLDYIKETTLEEENENHSN